MLEGVQTELKEVAKGFEVMNKALIVFCFLVAVSILLMGVVLYRQSEN